MEKQPLLSVIVPIYNAKEQYLKKCLDSLVNQTLQNIEIICVDNGSKTYISDILHEYARQDFRVKIFRIDKNNGISPARNLALKKVNAPYLTFADSDDWVEPECYEEVLKYFEADDKIDMVSFKAIVEQEQPDGSFITIKHNWHNFPMEGKLAACDNLSLYRSPRVTWNKIFKTKIIRDNNLIFIENCRLEDCPFYLEYCLNSNFYYFINKKLYHYRLYSGNTMNVWFNDDKMTTIIDNLRLLESIFKKTKYQNKYNLLREVINAQLFLMPSLSHKFKIKQIKYITKAMKSFAHKVPKEARGEIINYILKNEFYKIRNKNKNFPKLCIGNDIFGIIYYTAPDSLIILKAFGIKISVHLQKIFSVSLNSKKNHKVFNICGLKIKFSQDKNFKSYIKKITNKIFFFGSSYKGEIKFKVIRFLGITVKFRVNSKKNNILKNTALNEKEIKNFISSELNKQTELLKQYISNEVFAANIIQEQHSKIFPKFKNCNEGKDIVIVACGPTMAYYTPIQDAIHIGVNKAFQNDKIKLDYIFIQDAVSVKEYYDEIFSYSAEIFAGSYLENNIIPWINKCIISEKYLNNPKISHYYSDYSRNINYPYLEFCGLMDFGSVAFPATQFALYTNPKRIYLVGCDCSSGGYFDGSVNQNIKNHNLSYLVKYWKKLKVYVETYYPYIEIISINPVGLKGLFKDVYTQEYVEANPQLFKNKDYEKLSPRNFEELCL